MTQHFTISDLAHEFAITPRTIRFYEDRGLLRPLRKGSQRIYQMGDKVRLQLILRGKRLGFSLNECQELIALYDPATGNRKQLEHMLGKIAQHQQQLHRQIEDINTTLQELELAKQRTQASLAQLIHHNKNHSGEY